MKIAREGDDVVYTMSDGSVKRARLVTAVPVTTKKTKNVFYEVTCPFCGKQHQHGPVEGTRVPPCDTDEEYYLRPSVSAANNAPLWPWGFVPDSWDEDKEPEMNATKMTKADKAELEKWLAD